MVLIIPTTNINGALPARLPEIFTIYRIFYYCKYSFKTPGNYEVTLIVTDNLTGCKAYDTLCVTIAQTPTLYFTAPTGTLCEGNVFTFIATASPSVSPQDYVYSWSNGFIGSTMTTGKPGMIMVTAISPMGCSVSQFSRNHKPRPDVSLFPVLWYALHHRYPVVSIAQTQSLRIYYKLVWWWWYCHHQCWPGELTFIRFASRYSSFLCYRFLPGGYCRHYSG